MKVARVLRVLPIKPIKGLDVAQSRGAGTPGEINGVAGARFQIGELMQMGQCDPTLIN